MAFWVANGVAPEYRATGTLLVLPPNPPVKVPGGGPPERDNPYAEFSRALDVLADVAVGVMTSDSARQQMRQAGVTGKYDVGIGPEGGPMITVVTRGATAHEALNNFDLVSKGVQDAVTERQKLAGAPPEIWIRAEVLTLPTRPEVVVGSSLRVFAALVVLGLAGVITLAFLLEATTRRQGSAGRSPAFAQKRRPDLLA